MPYADGYGAGLRGRGHVSVGGKRHVEVSWRLCQHDVLATTASRATCVRRPRDRHCTHDGDESRQRDTCKADIAWWLDRRSLACRSSLRLPLPRPRQGKGTSRWPSAAQRLGVGVPTLGGMRPDTQGYADLHLGVRRPTLGCQRTYTWVYDALHLGVLTSTPVGKCAKGRINIAFERFLHSNAVFVWLDRGYEAVKLSAMCDLDARPWLLLFRGCGGMATDRPFMSV